MTGRIPISDPAATDRYRALFDNSADAILIIENDKFVECNQAAVDMLGYQDKKALLQCHPSELSPEYQPDGKRSFDKANEILSKIVHCGSQRFEWDHVKADGTLLPVEVSMTAIPAHEGYTLHIVWRDISERKRLEKELRHSHKMETLGNLAGGIAHDFNNTLVPIVTYSGLLAHSLRDQPKQLNWAQEINRAGKLAAATVKKLLAVSRQDDSVPITLNLEETVRNSMEMLSKLIGEDIKVSFNSSGRTLWVNTDPGDVEQILLNLASNARDALHKGGAITLSLSEVRKSGLHFARMEFTDNGVGMDNKTLEQIFDPFFTTKELGSGTGLGLSSVYELVKNSNGQVNVRSSLGKGTTIELLFPLVEGGNSDTAENAGKRVATVEEFKSTGDAHVLVVEDDAQVMQVICDLLDQRGYSVSTATDGLKALESLETESPNLILADVIMPQMSGPQMIREMNARGIHIPVVLLSGYTDDRLRAHGFDATNVLLIRKPFTASVLLNQVAKTLEMKQQGISKH